MKCIPLLGLAAFSREIRDAEINDAAGIARVLVDTRIVTNRGLVPDSYLEAMTYSQDEMDFCDSLFKPSTAQITLVIEGPEKQIIGFVNGKPTVDAPGAESIELKELYLLPAFQRHGLGRILATHFIGRAVQRGMKRVYVWVLAGNSSRSFYEKLGATFDREAERTIGGEICKLAVYFWDEDAMNQIISQSKSTQESLPESPRAAQEAEGNQPAPYRSQVERIYLFVETNLDIDF